MPGTAEHDNLDDRCHVCAAPIPSDGHWHIKKELIWGLASTAGTLAIVLGTWVWHLSAQAQDLATADRRVTTLEQRETAHETQFIGIADRLARIEPMVQFLVDQARSRK